MKQKGWGKMVRDLGLLLDFLSKQKRNTSGQGLNREKDD